MDDTEILKRLDAIRGWLSHEPGAKIVPVALVDTAIAELDSLMQDVREIGT